MSVGQVSGYTVEEPLFGMLDYIPLVSTVAGAARIAFGVLEATLGVVVSPIQLVQRLGSNKSRFLFNLGISNIVRGSVAAVPVGGNIAVYFYDHLSNTKSDIQNLFGLSKYQ